MSDQDLRQEFEEFKETSKLYEDELENEIDAQSKLINNLQIENENLKSENIAIKAKYNEKTHTVEKLNQELMLKYEKSVKEIDRSLNIVKDYENEVDHLKSKLREKEFEIEQVNEFYNKTLEDLAIACSELDFVKDLSQENMHRLREQVSDLNNELNVAKRKSVSFQAYFGHRVEQSLQKTNMKTILAGKSAQSIVDILLSNLSTSLLKYKQASI